MPKINPVIHFEMPYKEADRMINFYSKIFGWEMNKLGSEMGNYIIAATAKSDIRNDGYKGSIDGGFFPLEPASPSKHPSIVIGVENINEKIKQINETNGKILGESMDIPGVGKYVLFEDTEGNKVGLLQPIMVNLS